MSRGGGGGRTSQGRVLDRLRVASRKGDAAALALALDEMRTLAFSPRYWEKYLTLLQHPLARLVDLLVIKQGEKIARQKGWPRSTRKRVRRQPVKPARPASAAPRPGRRASRRVVTEQASLFPGL